MGTVTIDKAYFETLMRRAQFHTDGVDFTTPAHLATVTIQKLEHDRLLNTARQFANLQKNLFRGGVLEETLAILTKDDGTTVENGRSNTYAMNNEHEEFPAGPGPAAAARQGYTSGRNAHHTQNGDFLSQDNSDLHDDGFSFAPDGQEDGLFDEERGHNEFQSTRPSRPQYQKVAKRTVLLYNLPEGVTHADVTNVIRGGMLLDIYLRTHDRAASASVSFLEGAHAQEFFRHVKRHDLYIRGKRIEIRWGDRQFILPGHVANKIGIGATRNLVIRNRNLKHTEETIREDLEHIHNLVVIKVIFEGQNAYISTNSVHNSMFARTCMMSRMTYRGSKVDWDEDECAAPLVKPEQPLKRVTPKTKEAPLMNRFQLLNMDESEVESEDYGDHTTSGLTHQSSFAPSAVVV